METDAYGNIICYSIRGEERGHCPFDFSKIHLTFYIVVNFFFLIISHLKYLVKTCNTFIGMTNSSIFVPFNNSFNISNSLNQREFNVFHKKYKSL